MMQQEQPMSVEYDIVANALINCLSNGQNQPEKDNSLGIFLSKLYKNNTAQKPKRMNSIRLSRFNAFLYRINSPYPNDPLTNKIVHLSLIAMLSNPRNCDEEEDEQIILSIAKWSCTLIQNTALLGFYQSAFNTLAMLLDQISPADILIPLEQFQNLIKECSYLGNIELSAEDQKSAHFERSSTFALAPTHFLYGASSFKVNQDEKKEKCSFSEYSNCSITNTFQFQNFFKRNIQLSLVYNCLFNGLQRAEKKKHLLQIFVKHISSISPLKQPAIDIFIKTFICDSKIVSSNLGSVLEVLNQRYFDYESFLLAKKHIFELGVNLTDIFSLELQGSDTQQFFLQDLQERYKKRGINQIVKAFLECKSNNLVAPYLIASSEQNIPSQYIKILFQQQALTQRHSIVLAFLAAQNNNNDIHNQILKHWLMNANELDSLKMSHLVKILYMCLSDFDKNTCYSRICSTLDVATINKQGQLATFTIGQLKNNKFTEESRAILCQLLMKTNKLAEECLPLKIELMGICGQNLAMTKRIKDLNNLFQLSPDQILRKLTSNHFVNDLSMFTAAFMGLNNKMEATFLQELDETTLKFFCATYIHHDAQFARKLGEYCNQKPNSPFSIYVYNLAKYNIQSQIQLGNFPEPLASILSGKAKYNRLEQFDFSGYFYKQQNHKEILNQLWLQKKILVQLRCLLKRLFRKEKSSTQLTKEVKGQLQAQWAFPLGFKLVQSYFQAEINDPQVLRYILSKTPPQFGFLDRVYTVFQNQNEEFVDFATCLPKLLKVVFPQALQFFAKLIDSQAVLRKQKEKKKTNKKKKNQQKTHEQYPPILESTTLYKFFEKERAYSTLFGDPALLQSFDQLFKIVTRLPHSQIALLGPHMQHWLQKFRIFHQQSDKLKWRTKVLSYCQIWRVIFLELKIPLSLHILSRHFDILTELLNMHYENKHQYPEQQQQLLLTLLLVLQGCQGNSPDRQSISIEAIKNSLLNFKLPTPCQQHFYNCFTCNLAVCQVCAPFLHKHHDLTYTGKEGSCVHDLNQKKLPSPIERSLVPGQNRPPRRQEDLFPINFDMGDEEMDFNQHIRFRELMEYRLRQQQRDRDRQYQMMKERMERERVREDREHNRDRDRDRPRPRQQLVQLAGSKTLIVEQCQNQESLNEIKSDGSKSIRNIQKGHKSGFTLIPQFTPSEQYQSAFLSTIDAKPLSCILKREMQIALGQQNQQGLCKAQVCKEKYNFFKQSNYFKTSRSDYGGLMRGGFGSSNIPFKRNLLTANRKFLAFPSTTNGILLLSLSVIGMKLQRRQNTKAMAQFEQQRTYITNAVNNANLSFEPFQLSFSKSSQNLLAVVGVSQMGFFVLANQGKVQRFMQSDIKCTQPISKFEWIGKNRTCVFAITFGNNMRIGSISEDFKVRTGSKLKIQIDKTIKDFEVSVENHILYIYVLDQDGSLYKADFDHRDTCTFNIQDKKVQLANLGQLTSMILVGRKMIATNNSAKLHLIKCQNKGAPLSIIQTYDIQQALKNCGDSKIKGTFYMSHPKLIHYNQNVISVGCILRRAGTEGKKKGGALAILRISGSNNDLDIIVLSDDESVEFFEIIQLSENNYSLVAVEQAGNVWIAPYTITPQLLQQKEESRIAVTQELFIASCRVIKLQKLLYLIKFSDPRRCDNFKDVKDAKEITSAYSIIVDHPSRITIRANNIHKYFITGISILVDGVGQFSMSIWDQERTNTIDKLREVQVGFTLKQTLQSFVQDDQIVIQYKTNLPCISGKGIRIFGVEFNTESVYKKAFSQLHRQVCLYFLPDDLNLIYYLQNQEKKNLPPTSFIEMLKLKTTYKYSSKDLTLLMKLQLMRLSSNQSLKKEQLEEMIGFVRNNLFTKCQRKQFLQKSCLKLLRQLCSLYQPQRFASLGQPYEFRTTIDFYYFERYFDAWNSSRHLSAFEQLLSFLYSLIFKRITNLYLILQLHPSLIYQITFFYKNALHSLKNSNEQSDQAHLAKLISICPSYVAIICEFYQTLKNSPSQQMIQQSKQDSKSAERIVLDLLQQVFCATKKQLYRQIFVCPELYLERMFLTDKKPVALSTGIDIFKVQQLQGQPADHASRKASLLPLDHIESQQQEIELEQDSNKEMLEQQDRQMPSPQSVHQSQQVASSQIQNPFPKAIHKLSAYLSKYLLPQGKTIYFTYYQFNFEIATALFRIEDYLTKQNAVFYMGFLFNLLRIIEFNTEPTRDKVYLHCLFRAIIDSLPKAKYSLLYLVLNYFFQPVYGQKTNNDVRGIKGSRSKLASYFLEFVREENIKIDDLFNSLKVEKVNKLVTMTQVMKFVNFQIQNHLYALKFIGNIYILLKTHEHPQLQAPSKDLKQKVLRIVVKHNLRIFRNIMLMEGWAGQLQRAKVEVGFDTMKQKPSQGIKLLYECALKNKDVFVGILAQRNELIGELQRILGDCNIKNNLVLEMLNIYYESS